MKINILKRAGLACVMVLCAFALNAEIRLSLQDSRDMALRSNRNMVVAKEDKTAATELRKASFTAFLPRLDAFGNYTRINERLRLRESLHLPEILAGMAQANPGVTTDPFYATMLAMVQQGVLPNEMEITAGEDNNYLLGLTLSQPIFTGGKILSQYRIARDLEAVAEAKSSLTRQEVIANTDLAYWRVISLQEKLELARKYKDVVEKHATDLQNALEVGIATRNDMLMAEVKRKEAELNVLKAENGVKLAMMALDQLLGLDPDTEVVLTDTAAEPIVIITPETSDSKAEIDRPELNMLAKNADISRAMEKVALSDFMPSLALEMNAHFIDPNPYNDLETEFGSDWQIGIVAGMELFHFGERIHRLRASQANTRSAEERLMEAKELIELDIRRAQNLYTESQSAVKLSLAGLEQAKENLRVCQERFEEGMLRSSELMDAQTLWQKAYSDWIEAKADLNVHATEYLKALGRL